MKKIVLLLALTSASYFAISQTKKLKEGVAEFDISYPSLSEEMKQMESMLPKNLIIYFKNEQSRVDMNTSMGATSVLSNNTKKNVTVLVDMNGKKMAIKQSQDELAKKEAELKKQGKMPDFTVIETNETKKIAGYICKKAIVEYMVDDKKEQMICYYTDELPKINTGTDNMALKEIKGFLMEYDINQNGIQMRIVAKNIRSEKVSDKTFSIPSDYKIMTQDEIAKMMNGKGKNDAVNK